MSLDDNIKQGSHAYTSLLAALDLIKQHGWEEEKVEGLQALMHVPPPVVSHLEKKILLQSRPIDCMWKKI
jgi:hypothetical protein